MEGRITRLEHGFDELNSAMKTMSGRLDKVVDSIGTLKTTIETNKPVSYVSMLATAIGTATLVSMIAASIFFLIDARVGSATTRANAFVETMTNRGNLFVKLSALDERMRRIESAIEWTPRLVDITKAGR